MPGDPNSEKLQMGWNRVKLGDICAQDKTTVLPNDPDAPNLKYVGLEHVESGSGRILPSVDEDKPVRSGAYRFDSRHVLYGKLRPYLNKVALPNFSGRCTTELVPLLPAKSVDRDWLAWQLRRPETVDFAMRGKTGSRMPRANMREFMGMSISLPPLAEQKRIVARLNAQMAVVDRAKAAAREILDAAEALNAAIIRELMPYLGHQLADFWKWGKLGEICEINPRRPPKLAMAPDAKTTFVPMAGVDGKAGVIAQPQEMNFAQVSKGYTHFKDGDVLFAKITPCMQNGKHAIASGLLNGFGFGSTEFHVIRPSDAVIPEWIHHFVRQPSVLGEAERHFRGAVGQQRVPKEFLINLEIPIPPISEQRRIAALIDKQLAESAKIAAAARDGLDAVEAMPSALLRRALGDGG